MSDGSSLIALEEKWGWATEGADPDRLPDTLRRIELAAQLAADLGDHQVFATEIHMLHDEGAIVG